MIVGMLFRTFIGCPYYFLFFNYSLLLGSESFFLQSERRMIMLMKMAKPKQPIIQTKYLKPWIKNNSFQRDKGEVLTSTKFVLFDSLIVRVGDIVPFWPQKKMKGKSIYFEIIWVQMSVILFQRSPIFHKACFLTLYRLQLALISRAPGLWASTSSEMIQLFVFVRFELVDYDHCQTFLLRPEGSCWKVQRFLFPQ